MTHNELSSFTHDELSAFNHLSLSIKSLEEITSELDAHDTAIPSSILTPLTELLKSVGANVNLKTVRDLLVVLTSASELAKSLTGKKDFFSACIKIIEQVSAFLTDKQ